MSVLRLGCGELSSIVLLFGGVDALVQGTEETAKSRQGCHVYSETLTLLSFDRAAFGVCWASLRRVGQNNPAVVPIRGNLVTG
jgi:hypothetical protein